MKPQVFFYPWQQNLLEEHTDYVHFYRPSLTDCVIAKYAVVIR